MTGETGAGDLIGLYFRARRQELGAEREAQLAQLLNHIDQEGDEAFRALSVLAQHRDMEEILAILLLARAQACGRFRLEHVRAVVAQRYGGYGLTTFFKPRPRGASASDGGC